MARIRIEQLERPEEVELTAGQAGKVVGAGVFFTPYGGVVNVTPYYGTLGPVYPGYRYGLGGAFGPNSGYTIGMPGFGGPVYGPAYGGGGYLGPAYPAVVSPNIGW